MKMMKENIRSYFEGFDEEIRARLMQIRDLLFEEIPEGDEDIKYQMPTILYHGNLIHYAGFKHHIGIYPLPDVLKQLRDEIADYKSGKGSIQFQNSEALPLELIRRIARLRKAEKDAEIRQKNKA